MMAAFMDSQEETPISPSQSQDLFADGGNGAEMSQAVGLQILKYLKELDCKITKLQDDVKKIRKSNQLHVLTFNMASCSFKKKLNIYLKNKFSRCPWMDMRTDEEFKMEIKRCLQREGYGSDPAAFKAVSAWSAEKFTSFRNQLRRKIITEIKENRRDLKQLPIEEFASILLDSYCDATEDVRHPQRIQFALVLRSFLHHKKFMVEGSDEMEFYSDFWVTFKEFYSEVTVNEDSEKWAKLRSIDERRVKGNSNENIPVWIVKPSEIMKLSIANPEIAKKLVRQPKKQAMIEHPANASKWLEMGEEIENIHQLPSVKIPIKLFLDDTSAHKSKRWLALHCIQMQLSGIPLAEMQRQGNVHFVGATEKAEIMDIASVVIEDMREVQLNGIKSYDAKNKEPCLVKSCIDTVVADYAMMSYCCNHLGATATKYCPRCYADSDHYMTIGRKRSPRDTQFQLQRLNIRSGEKTKREFRKKKGIKEHKNVFWNELDPHNDIPIGMLHLIPLGLAKHLVKFIVDHSSEDIKSRMEYHLKDLYPDTCRFNNFFKYMDSRQGKDFKDYLQVATFNMMYAGVPRQYVKLVACLATIQKLLSNWQFSEEDIEIVRETIRIYHHLIHQYAPELKKKAKTHLLLHVVDDIRRHGPPKAYAEDAFEKNHGTIRNMIFLQNQKARSRDTATKFAKQFLCQHILSGGYYETEQKWDCAASQVVMVGKQPSVQAFMGNSTVSEERPKSRPGTISLFKRQTNKKPVKEHMSEDVILQALLCVNVQDHHFDNYNIKRGSAVRAKDGKLVHTGEWISYMNNDQEECIGVLKEGMVIIPKRGAQLQVIVVTKCRKMNGVNVMGCMMMEKTGVTDIVPSRCVLTCLSVLHNCASAKCRIISTVQSRQIEQESVNQPSKHIKHNLDFNEFVINRFSL